MKAIRSFIFLTTFLLSVTTAFAQSQQITESEYLAAQTAALEKTYPKSRRVVTTEQFFSGDLLTGSREQISEYLESDAERHVVTEKFGRENTTKEAIRLGDSFYCKEDRKGWKKSAKPCAEPGTLNIPAGVYVYSVETDPGDPSRKTFVRRATFPKSDALKKSQNGLDYAEFKFWVDDNGMVGRREYRRGLLDAKEWHSVSVTTYDFDPKDLRIESPSR